MILQFVFSLIFSLIVKLVGERERELEEEKRETEGETGRECVGESEKKGVEERQRGTKRGDLNIIYLHSDSSFNIPQHFLF